MSNHMSFKNDIIFIIRDCLRPWIGNLAVKRSEPSDNPEKRAKMVKKTISKSGRHNVCLIRFGVWVK